MDVIGDRPWEVILVVLPYFIVGLVWAVRRVAGYKDAILKKPLDELGQVRKENERLTADLQDAERLLTEARLGRMLAESRRQDLEREMDRKSAGGDER